MAEFCVLNHRQFNEFQTKYQSPKEPTCGPHAILNAYRVGLFSMLDINQKIIENAENFEYIIDKEDAREGLNLDGIIKFVDRFNQNFDEEFPDMARVYVEESQRLCKNVDELHRDIKRNLKMTKSHSKHMVILRDNDHWYLVVGAGDSMDKGKYFIIIDSKNESRFIFISDMEDFPAGMTKGRLNIKVEFFTEEQSSDDSCDENYEYKEDDGE